MPHDHGHPQDAAANPEPSPPSDAPANTCPSHDLLDPDVALERVLEATSLLEGEEVPLTDALDRVLTVDARAREDLPFADKSAMDGFALIAADAAKAGPDAPALLEINEVVTAGEVASREVAPGTTTRIMTGAPIPPGADCVVPWERTREEEDGRIAIMVTTRSGDHIVRRGEDIEAGDKVLDAGTRLRPQEIGVLASLGMGRVPVRKRPRVLIMATGDELLHPEEPMAPGKVRSSNSYTLYTQVLRCGAEPEDLGLGADRPDEVIERIRSALPADMVITSGGSAQGIHDFTATIFEKLGAQPRFHRVAIKPGKPVIFSVLPQPEPDVPTTLFFGLPGNPVASMVSFELFVRPALLRMQGHERLHRPRIGAVLEETLRHEPLKRTFMRGILSSIGGTPRVRTTGRQGSGLLTSMTRANVLIVLEKGEAVYEAGSRVPVILMDSPEVPHIGDLA